MKIYHYHSETLEYVGEGQADESPLESGVWLIPAHATKAVPPSPVEGKTRHFEGGAWVYRDVPPPPSPPEKTSEEIKAEARRQIEVERDAKLAEGVLWNGRRWHMDDVMRSALQWRIMRWSMGRLAPDATLPVRAMDNTIHMLGRDEHMALAEAIEATGGAIYAESWAKKGAL